ncbi:hypothetical protein HID58_074834, partial [Brassica napus]
GFWATMKRKEREEERLCRSRKALPQSMKRKKEADGNETSPSSKFDSLPFDLKMAIVSRMDAKSLMKFRCVSKIWSSIIRSRGFIDSFFSMSSKQSPRSTRFVGYDPIEGQHKALFVESRDHRSSVHRHLDHKVLTLGGGSWRHIEGTPGPYEAISVGVCVNGVIYYGARNSADFRNPVMVCFDVRTEKLSFIQAHAPLVKWDPEKHEWSKQHCVFPSSVWDSVWGLEMSFPGTNKDGEIIMAPTSLLLGIGDNKEFRRSYGFLKQRDCFVRIAPQHVHSIASL